MMWGLLRGGRIPSESVAELVGICGQALHIGFDDLGLHRIDLGVYDFNTAAIRCYELEGFVKEGHLRQARRVGDEIWSLDLMGILEGEWRQLESARSDANPGDAR